LIVIDGISQSCWKSVVVKALRAGWPAGLVAARQRLAPGMMRDLLFVGFYEDVWPSAEDLPVAIDEIKRGDYVALCRRETLHGRGYAEMFCDMADEAGRAAGNKRVGPGSQTARLRQDSKLLGTPLWTRGLNCLYTWQQVAPTDRQTREIDPTPFTGVPAVMADGHTYEGKRRGVTMTILSGHYEQHRRIGQLVMADGWDPIRRAMHQDLLVGATWKVPPADTLSLFKE
jgi:hypothetical protein